MFGTRNLKKYVIGLLVLVLVFCAGCVTSQGEGGGGEKTENIMPAPKTSWFKGVKEGLNPKINESAYISSMASVIGDVEIGDKVYVAPGASLRGDEGTPIFIGDETNVQDGVVVHGLLNQYVKVEGKQYSVYVGDKVCCAHGAIIHGPCVVEDGSFIGFNAIVFKAEVGKNCAVMHGALVTGGVKIAEGRMVPAGTIVDTQAKADALPPITEDLKKLKAEVVEVNVEFSEGYKAEGGSSESTGEGTTEEKTQE